MVTTPSGATGPYVQQHAELEAAQEPVLAQILHRVLMEMTALTWEVTPGQYNVTLQAAKVGHSVECNLHIKGQ